jgi:hypothetical protein
LAELLALSEQHHQFGRRIIQDAGQIEAADRRLIVIQAEHPFQPGHFNDRPRDKAVRHLRIRMMQLDHSIRTQGRAAPDMEMFGGVIRRAFPGAPMRCQ